jgi:hypothetical protein
VLSCIVLSCVPLRCVVCLVNSNCSPNNPNTNPNPFRFITTIKINLVVNLVVSCQGFVLFCLVLTLHWLDLSRLVLFCVVLSNNPNPNPNQTNPYRFTTTTKINFTVHLVVSFQGCSAMMRCVVMHCVALSCDTLRCIALSCFV